MIRSTDKNLLYPPFAALLKEFETRLDASRLPFRMFQGLRTWEDQDELYKQGRAVPGTIVTNAKGGESWHNYGLAADYVLKIQTGKPDLQWSWATRADFNADGRNDWMQLGAIASTLNLEWGGNWKRFPDLPHVQNRYGLILAEAKELYRIGGIRRVWQECSSKGMGEIVALR